MYKNRDAKITPGKTQPIMGTKIEDKYEVLAKIEGKKEAAIVKVPIESHYNSKWAYCKFCQIFEILSYF